MKCKLTLGVLPAALFLLAALSTPVSAQSNQSGCIAHRPKYVEGVFAAQATTSPNWIPSPACQVPQKN